jgi:hypothetical protein
MAKLEIDCLKVRWHDATLFVYFDTGIFLFFITFIQFINRSPLAEVRLRLLIAGQISWENLPSRESNSGLPYSNLTYCHLSYVAP